MPTATSPLLRLRAQICIASVAEAESLRPGWPSGSWSMATARALSRMRFDALRTLRTSLPMMSGAAHSDQSASCVRSSASVRQAAPVESIAPMSSMSGSFQRPGPATAWPAAHTLMKTG
eukprot:5854780-Pleurochrysis_carterae.AAC.1